MEPAAEAVSNALHEISFRAPVRPIISNVTGEFVEDPDVLKALLVKQITQPVNWYKCVQTAIGCGVTEFIEIGPGSVLSNLVRQIDKTVRTRTIQSLDDVNSFVKEFS